MRVGVNVNAPPDYHGRTALQAAAEAAFAEDQLEIVEHLLESGANVNELPMWRRGCTALQAAAGAGSLAVAERLLQEGADVNAPPATGGGKTELQAAAEAGDVKMAELLIKAGARVSTVERRDLSGW